MGNTKLGRRQLLSGVAAGAAALGLPMLGQQVARSQPADQKKPTFLIVIGAFGGASIIDSFLPIAASESANPATVNTYPDSQIVQPPGAGLRAVNSSGTIIGTYYDAALSTFLGKHKHDMLVTTMTSTSVNHAVAQKRSITGNGAWAGRTLQELVALEYGADSPMPNVNMSSLGFLEHGDDPSLPAYCYNEPVAVPTLWPLALDGQKGLKNMPQKSAIDVARGLRNERLDPESSFYQTFQLSDRLQRWKTQRNVGQPSLESAGLIDKVNLLTEANAPLSEYGLTESPDATLVHSVFPRIATDPLEAQAALAYLLLKNRASVAVTIGPNFNITLGDQEALVYNLPLSFDNSHTAHQATQAFMWNRLLGVADRLIDLLKDVELDPATGESFWDRTMIYFATDFGRSKNRPGFGDYGSMHDLNNGNLIISPLVNGNRVLGGVDPDTGLTFGFDPMTGAPDPSRNMSEKEIFGGLAHALGVDTSGSDLPALPIMYGA